MAEKLLSPDELRARARQHRETALATDDPQRRKNHLLLAEELDNLAAATRPSQEARNSAC